MSNQSHDICFPSRWRYSELTGTKVDWLKNLIFDIPLVSKHVPVISIHCDFSDNIDLIDSKRLNKKMNKLLKIIYNLLRSIKTNV